LYELVAMGALAQVTAQSLTGGFGESIRKTAAKFLRHNLVHIIASDAHDTVKRPPRLSGAVMGRRRFPRPFWETRPLRIGGRPKIQLRGGKNGRSACRRGKTRAEERLDNRNGIRENKPGTKIKAKGLFPSPEGRISVFKNRVFQSKAVASILIGAFTLLILPQAGLSQAKTGSMTGFIFGEDKTTPVDGAVVKVRDVRTNQVYQSRPTETNGLYAVQNLPEGRYLVGVSDAKGDFNFDYEVMVKGGETAKLALALVPASESAQDNQDEEKEKKKKKCFFLTPMGIAVLVAGGALLIYGGIQLFGEEDKSPAKR